ncbi:hypothetical protein ACCI51_17850 [Microbulbifer echini]|uniref:Uncharacterized protein n=1 Tax=Microbulbifer echini TaxID=1529067 RepID=A0ABV4NTR3_9GAMM
MLIYLTHKIAGKIQLYPDKLASLTEKTYTIIRMGSCSLPAGINETEQFSGAKMKNGSARKL